MSSELRLWIVVLVATSFLAGLGGGVLVGLEFRPPPAERGPFADYEQLLVERFDLSPERAQLLTRVMSEYHRRLEGLKARNVEAIEPDLVRLGLTFRSHVRDDVLPPSRRAEFDRLTGEAFPAALPQ